ncbi:MAG: hypothetical protein A2Z25_11875 [Planctomycetes bacterium RBG_16_55_9]|nr:MAG: hypothetical protein A2Z25_11875 [Planctomycetes bacterium RBG_16_55_9]
MADIHIGKITRTPSGKGKAQLFYHIPVDAPVSGIAPTPGSAIAAQLLQAELDALAAGSLVEVSQTIVVFANQNQSEIADAVRADWQNVRTAFNDKYNFAYKFYGVTLNATT